MDALEKAIKAVEDGNVEAGLSILEQVEETASDDEKYVIAQHYHKWGLISKAKDIVQQLLSIYPGEGELYILLSEIMIDLDEEEEAIFLLEKIADEDPVFTEALLLQADLFQMQGLYEVSEQKLLLARKKANQEPIIDFALAELYSSLGEHQKSIPYYQNVVEEHEELAGVNIHARLAESLSATGKFEDALPFYEKAISSHEDSNTLFGYGFTAYQAGYYNKAIEVFTRLKEVDPDYMSLYLYLSKSYEQEGMLADALEVLQEGISVDSTNKELHFNAGKISLMLGQKELIEHHLREAVAIDPGYLEATLQLSKYFIHEERFEDVVDCLETVMGYGEYDEQFEWDLAHSKNRLEQYSDALNHYRHAYTSFKETPEFLEEFGYFLLEEGNREEAIKVFKELLDLDSSKIEVEELIMDME